MSACSSRCGGHKCVDNILGLPSELLRKCIAKLNYEQISNIRRVNKVFDFHCKHLLNHGFAFAQKMHNRCASAVKLQLPRRESERRCHPLARHQDILSAVETRISLMNMTFGKHIEKGTCCFIPGKVLDETMSILRLVERAVITREQPPRPHELLQELRDISSMSMEYFDEQIQPNLPQRASTPINLPCTDSLVLTLSAPCHLRCDGSANSDQDQETIIHYPFANVQREQIRRLKQQLSQSTKKQQIFRQQLRQQRTETNQIKASLSRQQEKIEDLSRKYIEVSRLLLDSENRYLDAGHSASSTSKEVDSNFSSSRHKRKAQSCNYPPKRQMPPRKAAKRDT